MRTIADMGAAVASRRRALGLKQGWVAARAGIQQASLSRLERGHAVEFGLRKLLQVLVVLDAELAVTPAGAAGNLDALRLERSQR